MFLYINTQCKICWCSLLSLRSQWAVLFGLWLVILADSSPSPTKKIGLLQSQWHGHEVVIAVDPLRRVFYPEGVGSSGFLHQHDRSTCQSQLTRLGSIRLPQLLRKNMFCSWSGVGLTYMSIVMFFTSYEWKQVATKHLQISHVQTTSEKYQSTQNRI